MSKHLKRLAAPRTVRLHRKERVWTTKPSPGPHTIEKSIALLTIVRDYLHLCDLGKEAKRIISSGEIIVDGAARKDHHYPCGFMDVLSIPKIEKNYRILYDRKGKLTLVPIEKQDASWKLCRVENKTIVREKKIQLNLHDGRNMLVEKNEYNTGDVLKLSFADNKILDVYPFSKGTVAMIIGGSHIGQTAGIEDVEIIVSSKPNLAKMKAETEFSTIKNHVFPIGKNTPAVPLPEVKML